MKLFLDMDGCITDFEGSYKSHYGVDFESDTDKWKKIDKIKDFWSHMPWMSDGKKLWAFLAPLNPTILTAPSFNAGCRPGKIEWCRRELGADVPIIVEKNKQQYADSDSILIDDRKKNIDAWKAAGGVGILHTSTSNTIEQLRQILGESFVSKVKSRFDITEK